MTGQSCSPWPRIVAEALRGVTIPPPTIADQPHRAPIGDVIAAIRATASPARSAALPPAFLLPHQHDAWRRVIAALAAWRGALLAEPVGRGKTWIALGVAAHERRPVVVLVPAILRAQWEDAAARAGVRIHCWSHERASRGTVPGHSSSLVIIDEAHRFRDPGTRRVRTIAPWLVGRRVLLVTATPIVNRLADLVTLLRLALPDDALALDGIAALGSLDTVSDPPSALGRVMIRSAQRANADVVAHWITLHPDAREERRGADAVAAIDQCALSANAGVRQLLRSVLLDAAASSDAALRAALTRYRALLLQARDAGGASRAMLRRFAGAALDQLVFWDLVGSGDGAEDLVLDDLPRVDALLGLRPADDVWADRLRVACDDACPTIFFTRHRATAQHLRAVVGDGCAWITGSNAGIGPHYLDRDLILAAFGPARAGWQVRKTVPRILVTTDVAAEGLDLQAAGRVVHVDLPWTATRIDQREGRLLRLGQMHRRVDIILRRPAPAIERALMPAARVQRKRELGERWLDAIASAANSDAVLTPAPLIGVVTDGGADMDLVAVRARCGDRHGMRIVARECGGGWREDPEIVNVLLARCSPLECESSAPLPDGIGDTLASATRSCLPRTRCQPLPRCWSSESSSLRAAPRPSATLRRFAISAACSASRRLPRRSARGSCLSGSRRCQTVRFSRLWCRTSRDPSR